MMAKIKTKRALLQIVAIRPPNNKFDKIYYKEIEKYKLELQQAVAENNAAQAEIYRTEIRNKRDLLKKLRTQVYVFDVILHHYPKLKQRVELVFDTERGRKEFRKFLKAAEDEAIRRVREQLKVEPQPMLFGKIFLFLRLGSKDKGLVFAEEGSILKAHVKKNMKMLLDAKAPAAARRYVGIELEFCAPIKEEKLALKLFQNGIHKFGQLKEDGSLRPQGKESSFELALLLEETTYKKNLKAVTKVLNDIKAVTKDRRCGLHVHLDMRRRDKDLVFNNLVACQYALLAVVDPQRYNNEFCRVVKSRKFPTEFTGDRIERYKTINAAAYYKYRTLEVRMHEGSVSFDEISHWVDLLLKVANYSKFLKNDVIKLPVLKTRLKLKEKLYNYALNRSCSWQVQNNPNARNMREDAADLRQRGQPPFAVPNNFILDEPAAVIQPINPPNDRDGAFRQF
jgi:Putative amidoligase enzyme